MLEVPVIFARAGLRAAAVLPTALALAAAFAVTGPADAAAATTVSVSGTRRGPVAPSGAVATTVYLAGRDPAGLTAYARRVSEPGGADYREYLTPTQFDARFGATAAQIDAVENWLGSTGLRITSASEHAITASGTAAQTERAYGTTLDDYLVQGRTYRAPDSDARIPARVGSAVLAAPGWTTCPSPSGRRR